MILYYLKTIYIPVDEAYFIVSKFDAAPELLILLNLTDVTRLQELIAVRQFYSVAQLSTSPERWRIEIEKMIGLV